MGSDFCFSPTKYSFHHLLCYISPATFTRDALLQHLVCTSDQLQLRYPSSKFITCDDFNELDTTDRQTHLQLSHNNISNILNFILTDVLQFYQTPVLMPSFGRSTHSSFVMVLTNLTPPTCKLISNYFR